MSYFITTKGTCALKLLGERNNRDLARAFATANGGTVRTQAEFANLIADGRLPRTDVAPEIIKVEPAPVHPVHNIQAPAGMWNDLAASINKTVSVKNTLGKKGRAHKRVATSPETLAAAAALLEALPADTSKVSAVRILAGLWGCNLPWQDGEGRGIQRRDALALFAQYRGGVAAATVSTQWQLVRSGKFQATKKAATAG